jgi:hypothetical protein
MAHEVFISYAEEDKSIADAICETLEFSGLQCWIAHRDISPGKDWSEAIVEAIAGASVLVLVFSSGANESQQIKREVERAVDKKIPIIPFRIEVVTPSKSLEYFISTSHWLNAFTPPLWSHLDRLARTILETLNEKPVEVDYSASTPFRHVSGAWLHMSITDAGGRQWTEKVNSTLNIYTIGRKPSNKIVLEDKLASRYHAFILFYDNSFMIVDGVLKESGDIQRSTNGVFVNGEQRYQCRLKKDDVIQIADSTIKITDITTGEILLYANEVRRASPDS